MKKKISIALVILFICIISLTIIFNISNNNEKVLKTVKSDKQLLKIYGGNPNSFFDSEEGINIALITILGPFPTIIYRQAMRSHGRSSTIPGQTSIPLHIQVVHLKVLVLIQVLLVVKKLQQKVLRILVAPIHLHQHQMKKIIQQQIFRLKM